MHLEGVPGVLGYEHTRAFGHVRAFVPWRVAHDVVLEDVLFVTAPFRAALVHRAHEHVVHGPAIAGDNGRRDHPGVTAERVFDLRELIVDDAIRRHLEGRHFENQIRFAEGPLLCRRLDRE